MGGTSADIALQAKEILYLKKTLNEILSECTGQPIEKVAFDSERDFFLSAMEAKDYGLIDNVFHPKKK